MHTHTHAQKCPNVCSATSNRQQSWNENSSNFPYQSVSLACKNYVNPYKGGTFKLQLQRWEQTDDMAMLF